MADDFDPYYTWLGIPPKDRPPTHYRLLGVELFESNGDVIENAADRQMAHVRSFQSGPQGDISQKLLNEITVAKLCLLNAEKKDAYDAKLRAEKEAAEAAARPRARAVRGTSLRPADPAKPFDEGEDVVEAPAPRLPTPSLDLHASQPLSTNGPQSPSPAIRRRQALAPAVIAGVAGGVLVVAVIAFLVFRGGPRPTAQGSGPGKTPVQVEPLNVEPEPRTPIEPARKTRKTDEGTTPEVPQKTVEAPPESPEPKTKAPAPPAGDGPPALQLVGRDYVELAGTAETGGDSDRKEYVWMDDELPKGATTSGNSSTWSFVEAPDPVFRGKKSVRQTGAGQVYFGSFAAEGAAQRLVIGEGDRFIVHAYLDPKDLPTTLLLEFFTGRSWEHRAFWGEDTGSHGKTGTASRRPMGKLPKAGEWVRLEVPADLVGIEPGEQVQGFTLVQPGGGTVYWDGLGMVSGVPQPGLTGTPVAGPKEYVWIEDEPPAGAKLEGNTPWEFVTRPQPVFSGEKSTRRSCTEPSQHFFHGVEPGLTVGEGDRLFAYVYLDPKDPPGNVTLQFYANEGWHYRAFWGDDTIPWEGCPTGSPGHMPGGKLPEPGKWARLEIRAAKLTLTPGTVITGWAYTQDRGTAYYDHSGIVSSAVQRGLKGTPPPAPANSSLTAEMWVRLNPANPRALLVGNLAAGGQHPAVARGAVAGWGLWYSSGERTAAGKKGAAKGPNGAPPGLGLAVGPKLYTGAGSELDDAWHHVAVCREVEGGLERYRAFLDGKLALDVTTSERVSSPANLCLGAQPNLRPDGANQTGMAVRAFRLSSSARYQDSFSPLERFPSDSQTLALLDFGQQQKDAIADLSGNGHHGRIVGAAWTSGGGEDVPAGEPFVNLMKNIVWSRDAAGANWKVSGGVTLHGDATEKGVLRLPHRCPREYDLEVVVRRLEGDGGIALGLVSGDRRVTLRCDYDNGQNTILDAVRGAGPKLSQRLLAKDEPRTIIVQVRRQGITVLVDDAPTLEWRGNIADLSLSEAWSNQPVGEGLFLGLEKGIFEFERFAVRPHSDRAPPKIVYLDDLQEVESRVAPDSTVGKRGDRGYEYGGTKAIFRGRPVAHALSMHVPPEFAYITYDLGGRYDIFRAKAAILDLLDLPGTKSPLTFKVLVDGTLRWQSAFLQRSNSSHDCAISVAGARTLRLEIHHSGDHHAGQAAWLYPHFNVAWSASGPNASSEIGSKAKPSRVPVPKDSELEVTRRRVRDLFRADFDGATTPAKKEALAKKLLDRAQQGRGQAEFTYALLDEAREAALGAGDVDSAVKASEQLAAGYELDGAAKLLDAFNRLSAANLTPEKRKALVDALLDAVDRATGEEDFKAAADLLALTTKTAAKVSDTELRRKTAALKDRVEQTRVWFEEADAARAVLADKPDDAAANKAVGKYLCFVNDDWENGLEHLMKAGDAKADDAKLKAAATLELAPPSTPATRALAGDAWWDLAAPATGYWKLALQKRAQYWYDRAIPELKDPAKSTVAKRLATLLKVLGDSAGESSGAALAKRIVGEFFLTATIKKDTKTTATLSFAADGTVSDNQLPVGKWSVESNQIKIAYQDESLGTVYLRARGKDAFSGSQTRPKGDSVTWDLRRIVVVAVWDVYYDRSPGAAPQRLVLYSNGKGNDLYGNTSWSLSGGLLTLNWPDYRRGGHGLEGTFRVESGGNTFRGQDRFGFSHHGQRVAGGGKL